MRHYLTAVFSYEDGSIGKMTTQPYRIKVSFDSQ